MKAYLHSVRIAPKKANLVARMVRGLSVPEATEQLRRTNKKAARIIETLLRSAVANASHNDKQDAQMMVIKTIVVNQGQAYHRGMPMARGRTRPFRKFLSHIELALGFPEDGSGPAPAGDAQAKPKTARKASQPGKTPVKQSGSAKTQKAGSAKKTVSESASSAS